MFNGFESLPRVFAEWTRHTAFEYSIENGVFFICRWITAIPPIQGF